MIKILLTLQVSHKIFCAAPCIGLTFLSKLHCHVMWLNGSINKQGLTGIVFSAVYRCQCVNCIPRHWWRIASTKKFVPAAATSSLIGQCGACALLHFPMAEAMLVVSRYSSRRLISHIARRFQVARSKVMPYLCRSLLICLTLTSWGTGLLR